MSAKSKISTSASAAAMGFAEAPPAPGAPCTSRWPETPPRRQR